ncbi:hypothetical protein JD844_031794 [Phrynosoma platyrhinos]|uniref:G domain-containing protein n=1 Tax=Phrynosoma platyrhinos TaxID=52577 RepID=A0ABQ7T4B5_PHRPL|nr:hypothetical protein JD844_031794 [Phrynosoma platyrhinos]
MRAGWALRGLGWQEQLGGGGGRDVARWFPGHMAKGTSQAEASLAVRGEQPWREEGEEPPEAPDCSEERAGSFPGSQESRILKHLEQQGFRHVHFTDCLKDENVKKIVPLVTELISNSQRYQRSENVESCIMVIGVPNVGKSSLINSMRRVHLRKGKASTVGGTPGITRAVLTKIQVCERPLMFLLDTPGVLSPQIECVETGLKLALCGAIKDHLVGEEVIANYLLYTLNHHQQFSYVERYGLPNPCDNVEMVLKSIAIHLGKTHRVKVLTGTGDVIVTSPNYNAAACEFIHSFRKGLLGKVTLD